MYYLNLGWCEKLNKRKLNNGSLRYIYVLISGTCENVTYKAKGNWNADEANLQIGSLAWIIF